MSERRGRGLRWTPVAGELCYAGFEVVRIDCGPDLRHQAPAPDFATDSDGS
jgi:hypothetical protein